MKKILFLSLAFLHTVGCISIVSCNSNKAVSHGSNENDHTSASPGKDDYVISILSGVVSGIFKSDYLLNESADRTTEILSNAQLSTLQLGNKKISAYKTEIIHESPEETINVFISADSNTEYRVASHGNCFSVRALHNSVLLPYGEAKVSKDSMLKNIESYISSFAKDIEISSYTMNCSTSVIVTSADSSWRETIDGYYIVPGDMASTRRVINYQYRFERYCHDIKTNDNIVVICSPDGDILSMSYNDFNVDWTTFTVNEEKINRMVTAYLEKAIVSEYTLKNHQLENRIFVYRDNQIKLSLTYELTLEKDNNEIVVLCPILISVK